MNIPPEEQKKWVYRSNLLFCTVFALYILYWIIEGLS